MKVAIIHYWFTTRRGGEKVVESILKLYPNADIYTLFYDEKQYGNHLKNHNVYTSILNKPFLKKHYQKIFPLYPIGIKSLKLKKEYDLIISSESGPAKGIKINNNAPHLCYIHSPMRYCWGFMDDYLNSVSSITKPVLKYFFKKLKKWDTTTINNVDLYIANSNNVANRVKTFYNRDAKVVYPPISNSLFKKPLHKNNERDIYLSFGAITPYKRIDLLVDTFNKNGKKLIIIGDGSEKQKLEKIANNNITFTGSIKWDEIETILQKTKVLLFPGEEDFGMIPLEVMAYGIPVIAYGKGGALETIVENKSNIAESNGIFFHNQKVNDIQNALNYFDENQNNFNSGWIRNHAIKFNESNFLKRFSEEVNSFLNSKK